MGSSQKVTFPKVAAIFKTGVDCWEIETSKGFDRIEQEMLGMEVHDMLGRDTYALGVSGTRKKLVVTSTPRPRNAWHERDDILKALHDLLNPTLKFTAVVEKYRGDPKQWTVWYLVGPGFDQAHGLLYNMGGVEAVEPLRSGGFHIWTRVPQRQLPVMFKRSGIALTLMRK